MKYFYFLLLLLFAGYAPAFAQDTTSKARKPLSITDHEIRKRSHEVLIGNLVVYTGATAVLYQAWYRNFPHSGFHFFNDNAEWLQVDKVGHAWSAYSEGRGNIGLLMWAGIPEMKATWIGGLSGLAYQSIIEVLDGFSAEWGFSWGDYLANMTGSGLLIAQQLTWHEQKMAFKFSSHINAYSPGLLTERADKEFGKNFSERILKDYNAQTYWLSFNLASFIKQTQIPRWLNIAVGYGAEGMFDALKDEWKDPNDIPYDNNISRYRQFYIAPDIDLTRIKTKSRLLHTVFFALNTLKVPAPSIEFSRGKLGFHILHF